MELPYEKEVRILEDLIPSTYYMSTKSNGYQFLIAISPALARTFKPWTNTTLAWRYLRSMEMLHKQKKETKATEIATKSKNSWQLACLACNFKVKYTYHISWITLK